MRVEAHPANDGINSTKKTADAILTTVGGNDEQIYIETLMTMLIV